MARLAAGSDRTEIGQLSDLTTASDSRPHTNTLTLTLTQDHFLSLHLPPTGIPYLFYGQDQVESGQLAVTNFRLVA